VALVMLAEPSMEDPVGGGRARAARQLGVQRRNHRSDLGSAIAVDGGASCAPAVWCGLSRLPPCAAPVRQIG